MKVDVLLGLQWGDEGKGKVVDVLTPDYNVITRFQGGANAGHSLEFNGQKHVLHLIPSGIFHDKAINIIGNGVVLDPAIFKIEVDEIVTKFNIKVSEKIHLAKKANLILPTHRMLDGAMEAEKGDHKIGSTLKGIGPAYTDKIGRNALRIGDILAPNFLEKYNAIKKGHLKTLSLYNFEFDLESLEKEWFEGIELLKKFKFIECEHVINKYLTDGDKKILAEGAQGSLLDIDYGSYPFVTSSTTICAGACTGMGIAPSKIGEVKGIFKAYCTRVGSGPFPTELFDENGQKLRDIGNEYGSTTGRPRRCGWMDLVALKYAVQLNGVTELIMTKADVLDGFDTIKLAVAYNVNGELVEDFPYDIENIVEAVYKEFKGWKTDISKIKAESEFPVELSEYIAFIEKETGVPIKIVSVGPDREATIIR
ncbi:MAG: adenylosuccinate synthase [Salinivirgaceae bacterium]|jgi:adenylosuccinate synthase|nr:adenylosuccinate synthase [Salinivirgaceae bacterium]